MPRLIGILISLFVLAGALAAQELRGTWAGVADSDASVGAIVLDFDEKKVTLLYAGNQLSAALEGLKHEGGSVTFESKLQPTVRFTATLSGQKMKGSFQFVRGENLSPGGTWDARPVGRQDLALPVPRSTSPPVSLPKPTGKHAIGRRLFYWTDESRGEPITADVSDKRRVFVQLWYPAKPGRTFAEYFPDANTLLADWSDLPSIRERRTHAFTEAQPVGGRFPLIVFSPGLGTSPFHYTALIEELVSQGYSVAAINHPYDSGPFKFTDGSVIRYDSAQWDRQAPRDWTAEQRRAFFDERRFEWVADVSFVVDQLSKGDAAAHLDLERLGMLGHSFGGHAASIVCTSDKRFKACANLDGLAQGNAVLPTRDGKFPSQPFMFFTKSPEVTDHELKLMGITRDEYRRRDAQRIAERFKPSFATRMQAIEGGSVLVILPGATHSSFGDSPLFDPRSPASAAERLALLRTIRRYTVAFFDKYLKGEATTLLDTKSNEVVIRRFDRSKK